MESTNTPACHPPNLLGTIASTILDATGIPAPHSPSKPFPPSHHGAGYPWITATWAQSLDGRLAGPGGRQVAISGNEAFALTHSLRQVHDAIVIGAGTLHNDNPRLNVRLNEILEGRLNQPPITEPPRHPQPVVLDAHFSVPLDCSLLCDPFTVRPWIIVEPEALEQAPDKAKRVHDLGGQVIAVANSRNDLRPVFVALFERGVRSVMVEGGPTILQAVLDQQLPDAVIVTVAPLSLGTEAPGLATATSLEWQGCQPVWTPLGRDAILSLRLRPN